MVALPWVCILLVFEGATSTAFTTYRTSEDNEAAAAAAEAKEKDCDGLADGFSEDVESKREALQDYIGSDENLILEILRESNSTDELSDKAEDKITAGWLIKTAGAMVFSFVLAFLWLIICWTGCPCCKCCLCCRKRRKCNFIVKLLVLLALGGLLVGMFVTAMMALRGRDEIAAGMGKVSCTAAHTMVNTLDGDATQRFIGVLPMLDELGRIRSSLENNSVLMNNVSAIVTNTQGLERAQFVAAQALLLLEETLALPANKDAPETSQAINELLPRVREVNSIIATGLGEALTSARAEVESQLSSANRDTLRSSVDSAVEPLRKAADTVRDSMWFFIKDGFRDIKDASIRSASAGIISIACVIFLLAACGCCSGLLCTFKEYSQADENKGKNPWNPLVHRCALTTWCCGFFYGFLVFFFGGLMVVAAVPMASTCLVLDGIDSQLIRDILPALDAGGVGGDSFNMLTDIIDTCFSRLHTGPEQSLMDIVYFVESGNRTTLAQKLQGELVRPIDAQFDTITARINAGNTSLATDAGVATLKSTLSSFAWPASAPPRTGFRCDVYFVDGTPSLCDVKDMDDQTFTPDCVRTTSPLSVTKQDVLCTSAAFVTYINDWSTRIDKVLRNMDSGVNSTGTKISTELRASVNQAVISPVNNIVSNAYCSFLKQSYADFINGFCFQGVYGFGFVARAYVANGVLTVFLIIIAYILWRVGLDNRYVSSRTVGNEDIQPMKG